MFSVLSLLFVVSIFSFLSHFHRSKAFMLFYVSCELYYAFVSSEISREKSGKFRRAAPPYFTFLDGCVSSLEELLISFYAHAV